MTHIVDRALALLGLEGAVEHGQVLGLEIRRALYRVVLVDVGRDRVGLGVAVAEAAQRVRNGVVDDLEQPAADQLLVLDQRDIGLHTGRVTVHQKGDGAGWRQHGGLRVAVAVLDPK